jgi:hypothetical protein
MGASSGPDALAIEEALAPCIPAVVRGGRSDQCCPPERVAARVAKDTPVSFVEASH